MQETSMLRHGNVYGDSTFPSRPFSTAVPTFDGVTHAPATNRVVENDQGPWERCRSHAPIIMSCSIGFHWLKLPWTRSLLTCVRMNLIRSMCFSSNVSGHGRMRGSEIFQHMLILSTVSIPSPVVRSRASNYRASVPIGRLWTLDLLRACWNLTNQSCCGEKSGTPGSKMTEARLRKLKEFQKQTSLSV